MTNQQESTSERVVQTVQGLRKHRGWSAGRLAEECARHGHPEVTDQVIYNLEQRRREEVTVDQLVAFSEALAVPVTVLLGPARTGGYVLWFQSEDEQRAFGEALRALETVRSSIVWFAPPEQEGP
jgi:transcriptional regulator with XRE-family HTH domain